MSLFEILLGKTEEMSANPPPGVMATSTFTAMSRLHSQYINLCNTNDYYFEFNTVYDRFDM